MNVGDWVEFDEIVVPERTPTGSKPSTRALGRKRRGMVIGERTVYDVAHGNPPSLSNGRRVLLVAVAMGRAYRVDKANARTAKPPRFRRARTTPRLGDWVEFDAVAAKQPSPGGSRPASRALGRTLRGRVIGERSVFEVSNLSAGAPPTLANRQPVLLVATSLHRFHRVFPAEARLSAPAATPVPQKVRAAPGATRAVRARQSVGPLVPGMALNVANLASGGIGMANGRTMITPADLDVLVADAINRQVAINAIFTAYDITVELRNSNPALDIPHPDVRQSVHTHMKPFLSSDLYESETASFGTTNALRYVPT